MNAIVTLVSSISDGEDMRRQIFHIPSNICVNNLGSVAKFMYSYK